MKFEIVNPSDPYLMDADDLEIAAVSVVALGNGRYGAKQIDGDAEVPIFAFGALPDKWFISQFGDGFERVMDRVFAGRKEALARALESVRLDAQERSSLNDIGAAALELARSVRESIEGVAA